MRVFIFKSRRVHFRIRTSLEPNGLNLIHCNRPLLCHNWTSLALLGRQYLKRVAAFKPLTPDTLSIAFDSGRSRSRATTQRPNFLWGTFLGCATRLRNPLSALSCLGSITTTNWINNDRQTMGQAAAPCARNAEWPNGRRDYVRPARLGSLGCLLWLS